MMSLPSMLTCLLCLCISLSRPCISLRAGRSPPAPRSGTLLMAGKSRPAAVLASALLSFTAFGPFASPSFAGVGEGDLPEGAIAFSRLLKYQKEWDRVHDAVQKRSAEMDQQEVLGLKLFFKQLANEYYDMELLTKGIQDKDKVATAKLLMKDFKVKVRECDDALTNGENGGFQRILDNYPSTSKEISDFLVLMQDIPDEL